MNERVAEFFGFFETREVNRVEMEKFADLIRADEREALKAEDWTTIMREGSLVTWFDAEELGERVRAVIQARGNT